MNSKYCVGLLVLFLSTGCVKYASGYQRAGGGGSADAKSGGALSEACLKLAEKRKAHLKLQEEGEEAPPEEEAPADDETPADEKAAAACPPAADEEAPAEEEAPADE